MAKDNWKERECGSLWRNGEGEKAFYSGNVTINGESQRIVVFRNSYKTEGSKEADLRIYISKDKEAN